MTDDIQKRTWFKYYRDIEDFVLEAIRKSIENWEKCALTYETQEEPSSEVEVSEKPEPASEVTTDTRKLPGCQHYIGYLRKEHPEKTPLPNECLTCIKITECV